MPLEGKKVRLREVRESDLPLLVSLRNDLDTQGWSQTLPPDWKGSDVAASDSAAACAWLAERLRAAGVEAARAAVFFAAGRAAYIDAFDRLFAALDRLEQRLGGRRYLLGNSRFLYHSFVRGELG